MTGRSPTSRARRPIRTAAAPTVLIDFVEGPEGDRLLQDLSRALARQAAQKLFGRQDGTSLAIAGAGVGNDG